MPQLLNQANIIFKAINQLGLRQVGLYACYRVALHIGWLAYKTRVDVRHTLHHSHVAFTLHPLFQLPDPNEVSSLLGSQGLMSLVNEADEIVNGSICLFGGKPVPLDLSHGNSALSWTAYAKGRANYPVQDVKFLWEPARFGWAFILGRAYLLTGDERYAATFWRNASLFFNAHPPNHGLHWVSAQEVALRIVAFAWAAQVFASSPHTTHDDLAQLGNAVAAHAARIPATLSYARAQNNNHLLSEAVGLLTAGLVLRDHPQSSSWIDLGHHWLNKGLLEQISSDGSYTQHSTSYHRLMLQLALWVHCINQAEANTFTSPVLERLSAATSWLLTLLDGYSGQVPNLGANDGANILPLTICPHGDYRPVLQAASLAFRGEPSLQSGIWDEMSMWLGLHSHIDPQYSSSYVETNNNPLILKNPSSNSWAYFRCARFNSRPGHADQLHLDLWWHGNNITQDAGTYLYNAPPPWNNALTNTAVHNTITVDNQEQMQPAGRFLYLDWAQARVTDYKHAQDGTWKSITAYHDGYEKMGILHYRTVTTCTDGSWQIDDHVKPVTPPLEKHFYLRLHWLVPDWPWEAIELPDNGCRIDLESPNGCIRLHMGISDDSSSVLIKGLRIVRAGRCLFGNETFSPTWGWISPTYGIKQPALSLSFEVEAALPIILTSQWLLPPETQ